MQVSTIISGAERIKKRELYQSPRFISPTPINKEIIVKIGAISKNRYNIIRLWTSLSLLKMVLERNPSNAIIKIAGPNTYSRTVPYTSNTFIGCKNKISRLSFLAACAFAEYIGFAENSNGSP